MSLYDELLWRGQIKDVSDEKRAKDLLDNKKINFYCGFDPTGESLTVGHLVQVVRMKLLEQYGHTPIVLIGGATGLIGDPRETTERKLLSLSDSLKNAELIKKQLSQFIDEEKAIFVNNYDWIKKIDMITFLRDYGKHFNINYMLAKDTVKKRLDSGISYTEFSYSIIQAIDFLHLYQNNDCKIQFGGSDQWGNITSGLELIRKIVGDKNDAVGLSSPLLLKTDGTKFGKSESGALWLDSKLTSPYELYQYFLNTSDDDILDYFKKLTLLKKEEIIKITTESSMNPHLRLAQKRLAEEVCLFVHGKHELDIALSVTEALFSGNFNNLTERALNDVVKTLDNKEIKEGDLIVDTLILLKLAQSKREAREFISNGAITINNQKIDNVELTINKRLAYFDKYIIFRRGKKKYAVGIIK